MKIHLITVIALCLLTSACSTRHTAYTLGGSALGAGVGYSYNHNDREAAIGGLVGGVAGAALGEIEHRKNKKQFQKGFDEGYDQAQVDLAKEYWIQTTGKDANYIKKNPKLATFKVPERKEDGVLYESHYITLEDYR